MDRAYFAQIESVQALRGSIAGEQAMLAYFATPDCNVCHVLKPKIIELLARDFPRVKPVHVDCALHPDVAAAFSVLAVPTMLVFFDGREWLRAGRHLALQEFKSALARPYDQIFGSG